MFTLSVFATLVKFVGTLYLLGSNQHLPCPFSGITSMRPCM